MASGLSSLNEKKPAGSIKLHKLKKKANIPFVDICLPYDFK